MATATLPAGRVAEAGVVVAGLAAGVLLDTGWVTVFLLWSEMMLSAGPAEAALAGLGGAGCLSAGLAAGFTASGFFTSTFLSSGFFDPLALLAVGLFAAAGLDGAGAAFFAAG